MIYSLLANKTIQSITNKHQKVLFPEQKVYSFFGMTTILVKNIFDLFPKGKQQQQPNLTICAEAHRANGHSQCTFVSACVDRYLGLEKFFSKRQLRRGQPFFGRTHTSLQSPARVIQVLICVASLCPGASASLSAALCTVYSAYCLTRLQLLLSLCSHQRNGRRTFNHQTYSTFLVSTNAESQLNGHIWWTKSLEQF